MLRVKHVVEQPFPLAKRQFDEAKYKYADGNLNIDEAKCG
jgi:hypothetical protein